MMWGSVFDLRAWRRGQSGQVRSGQVILILSLLFSCRIYCPSLRLEVYTHLCHHTSGKLGDGVESCDQQHVARDGTDPSGLPPVESVVLRGTGFPTHWLLMKEVHGVCLSHNISVITGLSMDLWVLLEVRHLFLPFWFVSLLFLSHHPMRLYTVQHATIVGRVGLIVSLFIKSASSQQPHHITHSIIITYYYLMFDIHCKKKRQDYAKTTNWWYRNRCECL